MTIDPERPQAIVGSQGQSVTQFRVMMRAGIWQVTKDGVFYGHYMVAQPAFDAAHTAALDVVARGGAADILWIDRRPQGASMDRAKGLAVSPIGTERTMQFRAESTRILP